ncbi:hypothetical protein J2W37_002949 [Variovorax paradoxus]|uniref:Uncharacterized protein n=1 Tax=Variovorax paradoxus TaxID=34073 RepID=A0AAE3Y284_VARPD|nr:hypothetical protein [Variovorax paradoxus]MDR6428337.1 hypothetical protein [Variovorax paradoxus]MDR6454989.1 hypothetical protein [Variovorax paradoxus]
MRKSGRSHAVEQVSLSLARGQAGMPRAGRRCIFYLAVGITNSAPLPMLSGQRCMIDFCLV